MTGAAPLAPLVSVVVPAHDEAAVIGRCLGALARSPLAPRLEVVVAANGCTDDTVGVARSHHTVLPGLRVLDLPEPGKTEALNAGDRVASAWPRIYLDADIELSLDAVAGLVDALSGDAALVAAPGIVFDTAGSSRPVQMFYSVFAGLPYAADGLVGLGVFGLSRAGRSRFGSFPDVTADDLFVQRHFERHERLTTPGTFTVRTPRTLRSLVDVRTRAARGNTELHLAGADDTTGSTEDALRRIARAHPSAWPSLAVYVAVQVAARLRAPRSTERWLRDESTRLPV
jgi:glycosyltransferase involved in cell wall biosynthesis